METLVLTVHILACILLIVVVLLQSGHEGMGVIFGGGSSSMFGSTGAGGLLSKITAGLVAVFLITSLTYNVLTGNRSVDSGSIMDGAVVTPAPQEEQKKPAVTFEETAPAAPADKPAAE